MIKILILILGTVSWSAVWGAPIQTNSVKIHNPPRWLKLRHVERVAGKIETKMEWAIKRINVHWYLDQKNFQEGHGFDAAVRAYTLKSKNEIHIGPKINKSNFDVVFGHELVHAVLYQKYRDAIPKWIEEGMANYIAGKRGTVDYNYLQKKKRSRVDSMSHPFYGKVDPRYHYMASTAVMEMIAKKCDFSDLLQLSVGKKLETYIHRTCGLGDIDVEFTKWIKRKSAAQARSNTAIKPTQAISNVASKTKKEDPGASTGCSVTESCSATDSMKKPDASKQTDSSIKTEPMIKTEETDNSKK